MDVYMGLIFPSAIPYAPVYTAYCNGQALNISQNTALYAIMGNSFGATNTTFNVPDLRGRVPIGATNLMGGGPTPAIKGNYDYGQSAGIEVFSLTLAQLPQHTHTANTTVTQPTITVNANVSAQASMNANAGAGTTDTPGANAFPAQIPDMSAFGLTNTFYGPWDNTTTIPVNVTVKATGIMATASGASANTIIGSTGGGKPVSIVQPWTAIAYLIVIVGFYPPRQ